MLIEKTKTHCISEDNILSFIKNINSEEEENRIRNNKTKAQHYRSMLYLRCIDVYGFRDVNEVNTLVHRFETRKRLWNQYENIGKLLGCYSRTKDSYWLACMENNSDRLIRNEQFWKFLSKEIDEIKTGNEYASILRSILNRNINVKDQELFYTNNKLFISLEKNIFWE